MKLLLCSSEGHSAQRNQRPRPGSHQRAVAEAEDCNRLAGRLPLKLSPAQDSTLPLVLTACECLQTALKALMVFHRLMRECDAIFLNAVRRLCK